MFDIGWTELAVIACVTVLVVGPKELPGMLRAFGKTVGNLRRMAGDFQKQFNEAIREAELDEVRNTMKKPFQPLEDARKAALDFQGKVNSEIKALEKDAAVAPTTANVIGPPVLPAAVSASAAPVSIEAAPAPVVPKAKAAKPRPVAKTATAKPASPVVAKAAPGAGPRTAKGKKA